MNLQHPNIISLYDHFFLDSYEYMILEYCRNGCLTDEIDATDGKGLTLERFTHVAMQLLSAIEYCHARGIAHRDIKPPNILIDEHRRPKVADFGVSCAGGTETDAEAGTWAFLAPEVLLKQKTDRTKADIWALGVTFAYMIDTFLPWPQVPGRMFDAIVHGSFVITRSIPGQLSDLFKGMFTVRPEARPSAAELRKHPFFALLGDGKLTGAGVRMAGRSFTRRSNQLLMPSVRRLPFGSARVLGIVSTPTILGLFEDDQESIEQSSE
jgi:serine/threonine protein kinase